MFGIRLSHSPVALPAAAMALSVAVVSPLESCAESLAEDLSIGVEWLGDHATFCRDDNPLLVHDPLTASGQLQHSSTFSNRHGWCT